MKALDPHHKSILAMGCAKTTFGALQILRKHFGNDLDLAQVAFAMALRTRSDRFFPTETSTTRGSQDPEVGANTYYASINELSKFLAMDRATVRRKLLKLSDMGIVRKQDSDKWQLLDFKNRGESQPAIILQELIGNYLVFSGTLSHLLPQEVLATVTSAPQSSIENALSEEDINDKERRRFSVPD